MTEEQAPRPVRVELLGPLRLVVDDVPVDVAGPKRRAVLALLALAGGRTVPVESLLDALWPSEVPESGRQALHTLVSRLRGHFGPASGRLRTGHDGYRLQLGDDELDVVRARALLARARTLRSDPDGALVTLREARALWRGPVLADLTDIEPIASAVQDCAQLHREVTDALIAAAVEAGQAESVVGMAVTALADDPLREPAVLLVMRVRAATGAAAEALRVAREYRHRLADETGLDPSPAVGELEREIAGGAHGPPPAASRADQGPVPVRPTTRLIGRDATIAALHRLIAAERLVTLVGPGGVGKTRVAREIAHRSNAAPVVLLAPVTDATAVPHALAAALNLTVVQGDVLAACLAVLGDRPGVLVIDNCEHLLDVVRDTAQVLLSSCPNLSVLATSREPLGLPGEYTSRLPPLPLPRADDDLAQVPSVAVFLDRAARARPGPPPEPDDLRTVADIVHRLDGMPLAIELAAGRLSTFSLTDLGRRLDRSLDLLGGGRPSEDSRHRTLRATVDWSYQLLTDDEQRLFRNLAVFVDGVDLDTVERLAADLGLEADPGSVLARLVDTSMIDADFSAGTRYRMLQTLRAFGLDRLAAEDEHETAVDHLQRWAVDLTAWFATTVATEDEPEADAVLRRELANLRAAWRSARDRGALDVAVAVVTGLLDAVGYRDLVELRDWAGELADDPGLDGHSRAAAVLGVAAEAAYQSGDHDRAGRLAHAGLDRASGAADEWYCRTSLAVVALARGAFADAARHALAAAELMSRPRECLGIAALAALYAGDVDRARTRNDRGLAGADSPTMHAWGSYVSAEIDSVEGENTRAEQHYTRAIDLARRSGATFVEGVATVGLLSVHTTAGRVPEALGGYRRVIDYFARTGNWTHLWATLRNLAELLRCLGDEETAAELVDAAAEAPDAPALGPAADLGPGPSGTRRVSARRREDVLAAARDAVDRHLTGS